MTIWPDLRDRATRMAIVMLARDAGIAFKTLASFMGVSNSRVQQIERRGRRALRPHWRWHRDTHALSRQLEDRLVQFAGFWRDSAAAALAEPDMKSLRRWLRRNKITRDQAQYLANAAGFIWAELEWDKTLQRSKYRPTSPVTYKFDIEDELAAAARNPKNHPGGS